jgi:hypothetical protein
MSCQKFYFLYISNTYVFSEHFGAKSLVGHLNKCTFFVRAPNLCTLLAPALSITGEIFVLNPIFPDILEGQFFQISK